MSSFEIIGLIYFGYGNGNGLSNGVQLGFEITLALWHFIMFVISLIFIVYSERFRFNKIAKLVFNIILVHSFAKTISDILFIYLLTGNGVHSSTAVAFELFELLGIISYYCMYGIVLFSWIEVVFRVEHLGHGEEKVRIWRNLFCIFTSLWIIAIFVISELFAGVDKSFAIMVFGIGLIVISVFSFCLSIAFIVYWIKLHRMVRSIKLATAAAANSSPFLLRVGVMSCIFILCLDVKIVHYFMNIGSPFQSTVWDLYALNYLPEAIAVTVSLIFFASSMTRDPTPSSSETSSNMSFSETERANLRRREEKQGLLN